MNPLAIVKRTPKSNCGQCGYPACLAFGAAVATAGVSPALCPFIDLTGLEIKNVVAKNPDHDLALIRHLKEKISGHDLAAIAAPLGARLQQDKNTLLFSYLGQEVLLPKAGDILLDGRIPGDPRDSILLYNYVHSRAGRNPQPVWIGMESLPNSISKIKTLSTYCELRLAELFCRLATSDIIALSASIGGQPDETSTATTALIVPVLPMVPQYLLYWQAEPEDGFEAKVKILYDQHVLDFLDLESLVFSSERMADRLIALAG